MEIGIEIEKKKYKGKYVAFTEHNEHEGETWTFYIPTHNNSIELKKLKTIMDKVDSESFELDSTLLAEKEVDIIIDNCNGRGGYINAYHKLKGRFKCPIDRVDGDLLDDYFYKGGIRDYLK